MYRKFILVTAAVLAVSVTGAASSLKVASPLTQQPSILAMEVGEGQILTTHATLERDPVRKGVQSRDWAQTVMGQTLTQRTEQQQSPQKGNID